MYLLSIYLVCLFLTCWLLTLFWHYPAKVACEKATSTQIWAPPRPRLLRDPLGALLDSSGCGKWQKRHSPASSHLPRRNFLHTFVQQPFWWRRDPIEGSSSLKPLESLELVPLVRSGGAEMARMEALSCSGLLRTAIPEKRLWPWSLTDVQMNTSPFPKRVLSISSLYTGSVLSKMAGILFNTSMPIVVAILSPKRSLAASSWIHTPDRLTRKGWLAVKRCSPSLRRSTDINRWLLSSSVTSQIRSPDGPAARNAPNLEANSIGTSRYVLPGMQSCLPDKNWGFAGKDTVEVPRGSLSTRIQPSSARLGIDAGSTGEGTAAAWGSICGKPRGPCEFSSTWTSSWSMETLLLPSAWTFPSMDRALMLGAPSSSMGRLLWCARGLLATDSSLERHALLFTWSCKLITWSWKCSKAGMADSYLAQSSSTLLVSVARSLSRCRVCVSWSSRISQACSAPSNIPSKQVSRFSQLPVELRSSWAAVFSSCSNSLHLFAHCSCAWISAAQSLPSKLFRRSRPSHPNMNRARRRAVETMNGVHHAAHPEIEATTAWREATCAFAVAAVAAAAVAPEAAVVAAAAAVLAAAAALAAEAWPIKDPMRVPTAAAALATPATRTRGAAGVAMRPAETARPPSASEPNNVAAGAPRAAAPAPPATAPPAPPATAEADPPEALAAAAAFAAFAAAAVEAAAAVVEAFAASAAVPMADVSAADFTCSAAWRTSAPMPPPRRPTTLQMPMNRPKLPRNHNYQSRRASTPFFSSSAWFAFFPHLVANSATFFASRSSFGRKSANLSLNLRTLFLMRWIKPFMVL